MQHALLNLLACPACHGPLACHVHGEGPATPSGAATIPVTIPVTINDGLLTCAGCGRWYPIAGSLPELLPDHLRDAARDTDHLARVAGSLDPATRAVCERFVPGGAAADDPGAHHKAAEIGIRARIDNFSDFFGPGYFAPFNQHNTTFTLSLLHLFGAVTPLLECKQGHTVVDSGCGYAWTTEWLHRSGIRAIGVDICRTYLEIGMARMGADQPHLIVADVEHLPLRAACADSVLAYESFHHIPDRRRAMGGYARVLKDGGRVVLAEPGAAHGEAPVSVDIMAKYGILEKGMNLADVASYAEGTGFGDPEQIFLVQAAHRDLGKRLVDVARAESAVEGDIYRLRKGAAPHDASAAPGADVEPDIVLLATEAPRLRAQLTGVTAELRETQTALAQARDRIVHMERSLFWRARAVWTAAQAIVGSGRPAGRTPGA